MELRDLLPAALVIVVAGIGISVGAEITSDIAAGQSGSAASVSNNATLGLEELGSWFDTLGLVIAAAVVLGVLMTAFYFGRR
jgi:hypothetical protein